MDTEQLTESLAALIQHKACVERDIYESQGVYGIICDEPGEHAFVDARAYYEFLQSQVQFISGLLEK